MKPLDNGPLIFAGDAPTVGLEFDAPDSLPNGSDIIFYEFMDDLARTTTKCALAYDETPPLEDEDLAAVKKCANFKYFIVVFARSFVKPERAGRGFKKGSMSGDVRVYNADKQTFLGGFSFRASSSDKIEFDIGVGGSDEEAMRKDLADNIQNAIADRWSQVTKTQDFPHAS